MATVMKNSEGNGRNHLPGINTRTSLCGWCDYGVWSLTFSGEVTCEHCKNAARIVFSSCTKSEVSK